MIEVEFEGAVLECEEIRYAFDTESNFVFENLEPGDTYIGKRNMGWKMSEVASGRLWELTQKNGWIYGDPYMYPYDVGECLKVLAIKE